MNLKKIRIDKTILILSIIVILFQIYGISYIVPKLQQLMQETDDAIRMEIFKSLTFNIPFLIIFVVGVLSTLIYPACFLIKNKAITDKKWILIIIALAVYLLNLYLVLAVVALGFYLWKMWAEFQESRKKK